MTTNNLDADAVSEMVALVKSAAETIAYLRRREAELVAEVERLRKSLAQHPIAPPHPVE